MFSGWAAGSFGLAPLRGKTAGTRALTADYEAR